MSFYFGVFSCRCSFFMGVFYLIFEEWYYDCFLWIFFSLDSKRALSYGGVIEPWLFKGITLWVTLSLGS